MKNSAEQNENADSPAAFLINDNNTMIINMRMFRFRINLKGILGATNRGSEIIMTSDRIKPLANNHYRAGDIVSYS